MVFSVLNIWASGAATGADQDMLSLVTEDAPPVNMVDSKTGNITGITTEILRRAFEAAKIPYNISLHPWARAFFMAQTTRNTCVYSTVWTEERATLFKWVGPIVDDGWILYGRTDSPPLSSLEDARDHTIGGYFSDGATAYLKHLGLNVVEVADNHLNPKKVLAHRVDYWVNGRISGPYVARQASVTGLVPVLKFKDISLGLACNPSVPDEAIALLNTEINRLREDGSIESIVRTYQ